MNKSFEHKLINSIDSASILIEQLIEYIIYTYIYKQNGNCQEDNKAVFLRFPTKIKQTFTILNLSGNLPISSHTDIIKLIFLFSDDSTFN